MSVIRPSVRSPERFTPFGVSSLKYSPVKTALQSRRFIVVLLPERFRAGCAFGAGTADDPSVTGLSLNKPWSGGRLYENPLMISTHYGKNAP